MLDFQGTTLRPVAPLLDQLLLALTRRPARQRVIRGANGEIVVLNRN
jgi:hypothetical protein